ncbi:uncharacterized protein J4E88_001712 [Alternaria novae-zelandiae]|uniref:uncharacterized protein n=1 Tax=Alternaria novae-zelandiae TaxID=430562 RepID=UPI0020C1CB83|nr:uncharacterized protein J4E88_001712 [Alternaria novae-zelandiae]KAI4693341.1 hypothetical protein J4E88_001712 [Alternaria novae-zelandiae]
MKSFDSLKQKVVSSCGDLSFDLGGVPFDAKRILDFYTYKYNLTCLHGDSDWCLMEQRKWFVEYLPTVTWPSFTEKWYPDWFNDPINGTNRIDENGTTIMPYTIVDPGTPIFNSHKEQALDFRYKGAEPARGTLKQDPNQFGGLEYDEYPTEIQCSSCFLKRFKLGFMSRWGEVYNEVKQQAWDNIQRNCGFEEMLYVDPALDQSGPPPEHEAWDWDGPSRCDRVVEFSSYGAVNCSTFSAMYKVATGTLRDLNKRFVNQDSCMALPNGTYCLPEPCDAAKQVYDGGIEPFDLIGPNGPYNNISFTQFVKWNSAAVHSRVMPGDYVCIGPPGGAYVADLAPGGQGGPPLYTTTAVPAMETPPGTISNCGKYYDTYYAAVKDIVRGNPHYN